MSKRRAHYTARIANAICEKIALGNSLKCALDEVGPLAPGMPTFWRWLDEYPEFRTRYDRARQMQADIHADVMLDLASDAIAMPSKAAAIKVAADILKWQAEIRDPKRYSRGATPPEEKKQLSPEQLRREIKTLQLELGVTAVPGMNTAPNFKRKPEPGSAAAPDAPSERSEEKPTQPKSGAGSEQAATCGKENEATVNQRTEHDEAESETDDAELAQPQTETAPAIEGAP